MVYINFFRVIKDVNGLVSRQYRVQTFGEIEAYANKKVGRIEISVTVEDVRKGA